jgi:hypothetical protein
MKKVDLTECSVEEATDFHMKFLSLQMREKAYTMRRNSHCGARVHGTEDLFSLGRFHGLKY